MSFENFEIAFLLLTDYDEFLRRYGRPPSGSLPIKPKAEPLVSCRQAADVEVYPFPQDADGGRDACEALETLPADELVKVIVPVLTDRRGDVRASACKTLRKLPVNELVKLKDYMVPLLTDANWLIRQTSLGGLVEASSR